MGNTTKTLLEIIEERGRKRVASDLGVDESYISHLRHGRKPITAALLAKAEAAYGQELDLRETLRQMRVEDYEKGLRLKPGSPGEVCDAAQP